MRTHTFSPLFFVRSAGWRHGPHPEKTRTYRAGRRSGFAPISRGSASRRGLRPPLPPLKLKLQPLLSIPRDDWNVGSPPQQRSNPPAPPPLSLSHTHTNAHSGARVYLFQIFQSTLSLPDHTVARDVSASASASAGPVQRPLGVL